MPVAVEMGAALVRQTAEEKEAEQQASKAYINRNKRRHVFLTPPDQLKDLLLGIHLYRTTVPDVFAEEQAPHTVKVGAKIEVQFMSDEERAKWDEDQKARELSRRIKEQKQRLKQAPQSPSIPLEAAAAGEGEGEGSGGLGTSARGDIDEPEATVLQRLRHIHNTRASSSAASTRRTCCR
jgi:hypothetical protein